MADELISTYINQPGIESDLKDINDSYFRFCELRSSENKAHYSQKRWQSSENRIFVAVMLKIHFPKSFQQSNEEIYVRHGFVKYLAMAIKCKRPYVSRLIRAVVFQYKTYEDFKQQVDSVSELLS